MGRMPMPHHAAECVMHPFSLGRGCLFIESGKSRPSGPALNGVRGYFWNA